MLIGCTSFPPAGKITPLKLDDPKAAAMTFAMAIGNGDPNTADAASLGTAAEKHWALATADMVNGLRNFDNAMLRHFGGAAANTHASILNALNELTIDPAQAIEASEVEFNDDKTAASLRAKASIYASHMFYAALLKKDGKVWKVDLPGILAQDADFGRKNESSDLDHLHEIGNDMRSLASEVLAGRYATVDDAENAAAAITPADTPETETGK